MMNVDNSTSHQIRLSKPSERFGPALAKGGLAAFFIRITLRGTLRHDQLRFENTNWGKTVWEQLCLHKHRSAFQHTKKLKIWIVNLSGNPSFDEDILRGTLEHGRALPMKPEAVVRCSGYKDPDAVAKSNSVEFLDYGEPLEPPKAVPEKQPIWFDFGQKFKNPSEIEQSTAHSSGSGFGAAEHTNWRDSRLSELEDQLEIQTVARETAETINVGLRQTIELQDARAQEARNDIFRLNLLQSRDLMLAIYNRECITHAKPDISALATALAFEKGITRGDRHSIGADTPSVYVGQPTVDRLPKNPYFISNFLNPQKDTTQRKRSERSETSSAGAPDEESNTRNGGKRVRLE